MRGVSRHDLHTLLQCVEEPVGERGCTPTNPAAVHATGSSESLITWQRHCLGDQRPPLSRNPTVMMEENAMEEASGNINRSGCPELPAQAPCTTHSVVGTNGGEGDALHVTQFIRRHDHGDALRIAASVLYATVGVIETQTGRNNKTVLIRTIAGAVTPSTKPSLSIGSVPGPPLNPAEARQSSQRLVDEVTVHCDILGRPMQTYSGETMAHEARVRSHLARMEHSPARVPDRRVRPRTGARIQSMGSQSEGTFPQSTEATSSAPPQPRGKRL